MRSVLATGGALAAGTVLGWSSPAEIRLTNQTEYGFKINDEEWSWIGSMMTLGAALMCLLVGTVVDLIGRKRTMLALIIPFTVGWALVIWAQNVYMLYVGRFLLGIAGGAFFVAAPIYIGEIAEKDIRGTLCSFFQLMVTVGILFAYAIGYFMNVFTFSIVCAVIPLVFGLIFVFMPESPHYWVLKNETDNAIKTLKWLRGDNYNYNDELEELYADNAEIKSNNMNAFDLLTTTATMRALLITLGLMFFLQMSGINAVIFYTGFIFEKAETGIDGALAACIVGIMQVIATFTASMVVDRLGRRILLLTSASIMCICNVLLGVYFYLLEHHKAENIGWLPILSLCLYVIAYSLGFGPIPWVLIGELFVTEIKGLASSVSGSTAWLLAFLVTKSFTNVRDAIGLGETFSLFAIFSLSGMFFVWFIVPETKGKSFAEIQKSLSGKRKLHIASMSPHIITI